MKSTLLSIISIFFIISISLSACNLENDNDDKKEMTPNKMSGSNVLNAKQKKDIQQDDKRYKKIFDFFIRNYCPNNITTKVRNEEKQKTVFGCEESSAYLVVEDDYQDSLIYSEGTIVNSGVNVIILLQNFLSESLFSKTKVVYGSVVHMGFYKNNIPCGKWMYKNENEVGDDAEDIAEHCDLFSKTDKIIKYDCGECNTDITKIVCDEDNNCNMSVRLED
jgi:hypothetical protein